MLKRLTDVRWIVASAQNIHLSATLFCTGGRLHPTKKVVVSKTGKKSSNKMIEKKIVKDRKLAKSVREISDADFNYASKLLDESKKNFTLTDLLLMNVPDSQASLQTEVIRAWILNCKTLLEKGLKKAAYNDMEMLFRLLQSKEIWLTKDAAELIVDFYGHYKGAKIVRLFQSDSLADFSKYCNCCEAPLVQFEIADKSIMKLRGIVERVIEKYESKPEIVKKIHDVTNEQGPFDLVIDAGNVRYTNRNRYGEEWRNMPMHERKKAYQEFDRNLFQVVEQFSKVGWKVLIIGKGDLHLSHLFVAMQNLESVSILVLDSHCEDDLYVLLATLMSGINCVMLTNDYYENYYHDFDDKSCDTTDLFLMWHVAHKLSIDRKHCRREDGTVDFSKLVFSKPMRHLLYAHQSPKTGRWHIPIIPEECLRGFFIPHKWLCVKP